MNLEQVFQTPEAFREQSRDGIFTSNTASQAPGYVQANLVIVRSSLAEDFLRYCQRNPKPCPLLAVSEPGERGFPSLGNIDIATDLPAYNIYKEGQLSESLEDVSELWEEDFVSFALGCSYSFEEALISAGLGIRHIEENKTVPMFKTNIPTVAAGPFSGSTVVSMRPFKAEDAIRAIQITSRFPSVHGAPIHFGNPEEIGITDIYSPDWGHDVTIAENEVPVFWACGVTPQVAIMEVKPDICITHRPGHMLITDLKNQELAAL